MGKRQWPRKIKTFHPLPAVCVVCWVLSWLGISKYILTFSNWKSHSRGCEFSPRAAGKPTPIINIITLHRSFTFSSQQHQPNNQQQLVNLTLKTSTCTHQLDSINLTTSKINTSEEDEEEVVEDEEAEEVDEVDNLNLFLSWWLWLSPLCHPEVDLGKGDLGTGPLLLCASDLGASGPLGMHLEHVFHQTPPRSSTPWAGT
jgi:hypothetical protein